MKKENINANSVPVDTITVTRAIEAYKSNCVFFNQGKCNFSGTPCGAIKCDHLELFIKKIMTEEK